MAVLLLFFLVFLTSIPGQAATAEPPFFLMGSGRLHLKNLRNNEAAQVSLLNADGSLNDEAFARVDKVFGYPPLAKGDHVSPRMLFMLSYFADLVAPGRLIFIESGYRSPDYNEKIRQKGANAARTSTHIDAMALDFRIDGVDAKKLWQTIREKNCCGVGHYGGDTLHLDAGRPRFWEAKTSGTGSKEPDYNRHIYLSPEFDRYRRQAPLRLILSGISTFGFGVNWEALLYRPDDQEKPMARVRIGGDDSNDCRLIPDLKTARFLETSLPPDLPNGRYRIKLEFCNKPFPQMPSDVLTREIEVYEAAPTANLPALGTVQ